MRPKDIQIIGQDLAIRWEDSTETFISIESLRRFCPCAGCQGEKDVMGNLHKGPEVALTERSFQLRSLKRVGGYGIQPLWADGHSTGIYSFDYLKRMADVQKI